MSLTCDQATQTLLLDDDLSLLDAARRHQQNCELCSLASVSDDFELDALGLGPEKLGPLLPLAPNWLRVGLGTLGVVQLLATVPWLLDFDPFGLLGDSTSASHQVRDGALGIIVGFGALMSAWRPRYALPAFMFASLALVAQAVAGVADESIAQTGSNEIVHITSIVLTCLTGLASMPLRSLGPKRQAPLRSVKN